MFGVQELHYASDHLLSPAHASGTACQLAFVIRHCPREHSQHCWKLTCLFNGRGADVFELAPQKCTLWYDDDMMMMMHWILYAYCCCCCYYDVYILVVAAISICSLVIAGIPCQDPVKRKTLADCAWNIRSRPGARPQVCSITVPRWFCWLFYFSDVVLHSASTDGFHFLPS